MPEPIKIPEKEQNILRARQAALSAAIQFVAELHDAKAGWRFSPDFSELIPAPSMEALNLTGPPEPGQAGGE